MKIVAPDAAGIVQAVALLKVGGVIAHATETCYGLACDLSNQKAVDKLFAIKARPANQPVSVLFASVDQAKKYVQWNDEAERLAKEHLPGPVTLILRFREDGPSELRVTSYELREEEVVRNPSSAIRNQTIGVRVSPHPVALALVTQFGTPISTTSANLHGQPNPYSPADIVAQLQDHDAQPDLILDSGILPKVPPSTVIDLSGGKNTIRRQGSSAV